MSNMDTLKKHNFTFNKGYGQNFIFDRNLLQAIVSDVNVNNQSVVLEIGPGAGTLTKVISENAKHVLAYEIDQNLKPVLADNLSEAKNVEIVFKDILKEDISVIENKLNNQPYSIIANLPYYITTPIIFKFVEEANNLTKMAVMVQKEVADRMVAKHGTKDYGLLTVSLGAIADVKISRVVKRNMFTPAPNVDSAIVLIEFNKQKHDIHNAELFKKLTKSAFAMRRKTLANNLKVAFGLNQTALESIFAQCNLPAMVRGESLSVAQFVLLANVLAQKTINS